jgi:hypothetical protein
MAVLVYLFAIGIPVYLLHHFHSQASHWHVLALLGALGIGLTPTPPERQKPAFDLVFGSVRDRCAAALGFGRGLMLWRPHREKHAYKEVVHMWVVYTFVSYLLLALLVPTAWALWPTWRGRESRGT